MNKLIETTECTLDVLEEEELSEKGKVVKPMRIGGVASRGNVTNENGRYYKTSLWERESNRLQDSVNKGGLLGSLDHPNDGKGKLKETAIKFTKLFMDKDFLKFEGNVLETRAGKDLKALLTGQVKVEISTRGFGSTKEEKINGSTVSVIQDDFRLAAIDVVSGHSNTDAEIQYFKERKTENEGGNNMKIDELREKHPELVAIIVKETEDRVSKEVTEKLTKTFEEKVIDEISKTRTEMTAEITKTVTEELMPEHEENQAKLVEIADIVSGLIEDNPTPDKKDEEFKVLEKKLTESTTKMDKLVADLKTAQGKISHAEVKEYIDETLKNEPFKVVLKERLALCLSKEEVDKQLPKEKEYVQKIVQESGMPKGKGETLNDNDKDAKTKEQLDEDKKRQRRLAGIPEPEDK